MCYNIITQSKKRDKYYEKNIYNWSANSNQK